MLKLAGCGLTGALPGRWLSRLTALRSLRLSGNDLAGPVPLILGDGDQLNSG